MQAVIHQLADRGCGHVHAGVGRGVIDEHRSVGIADPAVAEQHVHDVADVFAPLGGHEEAGGLRNHARGIIERRHIQVQHITQAAGAAAHAVRQVQPALRRLEGMRSLPVLDFLDGMVVAQVDDLFGSDDGMFHGIDQGPADAAAAACIDESVLRTGIKGIFSVNEFGMQHHVALLALRFDVREALPVDEVARAGHAGSGHGGRQVAGLRRVLALHAEDAVNPAVLVRGQAHVINIGGGLSVFGHRDGTRPEAEVVHAVRALGHGKERLAVRSFDAGDQHIFSFPFDGARIHDGMNAEAFHQPGIRVRMQVIAPFQRCVRRRQHRIRIAAVNPVSLQGNILSFKQLLVRATQPEKSFVVGHSSIISSLSAN